ncbi:unnamed protein product [Rotaria sp. Silwood2]|nr:unnamed protein product [Rotaria sp. Silwood2]
MEKIDCLDEVEDEKHCLELHMNQCDDNEYQCLNGMCIDKVFLLETEYRAPYNYECIDQSDEPIPKTSETPSLQNPDFQCEEATSRFPDSFSCGDGGHIPWPIAHRSNQCHSNRDQVFNYDLN